MGTICKATSEILIVETNDFFIKELDGGESGIKSKQTSFEN